MKSEDLIALNDEISGMARAGLPLDQGLSALASDMGTGRLQRVTEAIAIDLRAGRPLPEALDRQGTNVPPFYAGLVSAGIRTGRLGEVLATLTVYARVLANLRGLVLDALFYPAIVLLAAFGLFTFLAFVVVPQFEKIFQDFQLTLPWLTQTVLIFGRHPLEFFVFPLLLVVATVLILRVAVRSTAAGQRLWARFIYSLPILGTLVRSARLTAFTELLAILIDHETPLPEAFRMAGNASSDPVMANKSEEIYRELCQGQTLGAALKGRGLVPEWVSWMAGLGEHRGNLGSALHAIAQVYRRQAELRASILRSVLPPFMILVTAGFFTFFFVIAMMLPMIKLLESLSKG